MLCPSTCMPVPAPSLDHYVLSEVAAPITTPKLPPRSSSSSSSSHYSIPVEASYSLALSKTALSCTHATQIFPSFVRISPLTFAVLFPAATTQHSTTHSVPIGTGRRYVQLSVRLTCPPSKKPGRAIVSRTVEVRESSSVAAQPPCRLPLLLQSSGAQVKDQRVDCDSAEAATKRACCSGRASKQADSPGGGGAVSSSCRARTRSAIGSESCGRLYAWIPAGIVFVGWALEGEREGVGFG